MRILPLRLSHRFQWASLVVVVGCCGLAIAQGHPPVLVSIEPRPVDDETDGFRVQPLLIEFSDADGDLIGGWLRLVAGCTDDEAMEYKIELQNPVFEQHTGSTTIQPILAECEEMTIEARLEDSTGLVSEAFGGTFPIQTRSRVRSFELPEEATLYDDFDGNGARQTFNGKDLAVVGAATFDLWAVSAQNRNDVRPVRADDFITDFQNRGFVVRALNAEGWRDFVRLFLISPRFDVRSNNFPPREGTLISWQNVGLFQADVMVSSESSAVEFSAGLDLSIGLAPADETSNGRSRSWQVGLRFDPDAPPHWFAYSRFFNGHSPVEGWYENIEPIQPDTWYTLGIHVKIIGQEVRLLLYLDGERVATVVAEDSAEMLAGDFDVWSSLARSLVVYKPVNQGQAVAYFDSVTAKYEDRIE